MRRLAAVLTAAWLLAMPVARADTDVVAAARTAIGKPYRWGAAGPGEFDCSGLVFWSFAQVGIEVPRTSQAQAAGGQPVDRADLLPGDVVAFYANASHVGIYAGDGQVIHASSYRHPVAEVPIDQAGPYNTARRYGRKAVTDTLFADVSEFQVPVDDSYPYPVLSIRVCDGTYVDHNFAQNYAWMRAALDSGRLTFGIVYTYVRPGTWQSNAQTVIDTINANGGLHPRVALMLDVERGGNPAGDQSAAINALYDALAQYAGSAARIIGYANAPDETSMWQTRPAGLRIIGAGYPTDPHLPGEVAHQYTDGTGYGSPLPQGCPPFGNCDMNSADGLSPDQFAAACGIDTGGTVVPQQPNPPAIPKPADEPTQESEVWDQLLIRWDMLGGHTIVEALAVIGQKLGIDGFAPPPPAAS
nr:NlpC/P60 family protein [Mycobacterium eburneum]